jgi:hypothetical protein
MINTARAGPCAVAGRAVPLDRPALVAAAVLGCGPCARASTAELAPQKLEGTLAFMSESRWVITPTQQAIRAGHGEQDYDVVSAGLTRRYGA